MVSSHRLLCAYFNPLNVIFLYRETDYSLFLSGISVNPKNAKLYNNVGHFLETQGKHLDALEYFHTAIK